jgi:hypothetical protein
MKMITKLRRLKCYCIWKIYGLVLEKCSEELLPQSSSDFIYAIIVEEYRWLWCSNFIFIALVSICCSLTTNTLFGSRRWTRFSDDFQAMVNMAGRVIAGNGTDIAADK